MNIAPVSVLLCFMSLSLSVKSFCLPVHLGVGGQLCAWLEWIKSVKFFFFGFFLHAENSSNCYSCCITFARFLLVVRRKNSSLGPQVFVFTEIKDTGMWQTLMSVSWQGGFPNHGCFLTPHTVRHRQLAITGRFYFIVFTLYGSHTWHTHCACCGFLTLLAMTLELVFRL